MDITSGFLELLNGEIMGLPGGWVNMASETQDACHNYKLAGAAGCGSLPAKTLYIQLPAFETVQYATNEEGFENANKEKVITWIQKSPVVKFVIGADAAIHNTLEIIGMIAVHGTVTFENLVDSVVADVKAVKVNPSLDDAITRLEITVELANAAIESSICCGSYYEDAPFNECDGEGETGDPSDDPACVGFVVAINVTTGPDLLTAVPSGGGPPVGPITYNWYRDDVFIGTGVSITPTIAGTYRVDVQQGNCYITNEVTWSVACEGLELTIQEIELGDGSVALIALSNLITTSLQWQELIAAVWTDITGETGLMYQPDHSGSYRVIGEATGGCTDESDQVDVVLEVDECDGLFSVTLEIVDGVPTATVVDYAGVGTIEYAWFYDPGDGSGPAEGIWTGSTVPDANPGLYIVVVTIDGCTVSEQVLLGCESTTTDGCNGNPCCDVEWSQEFIGTGTEVSFHVTNFTLPDPALLSDNQIESKLLVIRDTATIRYKDTPAGSTQYGVDYAGQNITVNAAFPLEDGAILVVRKIRL